MPGLAALRGFCKSFGAGSQGCLTRPARRLLERFRHSAPVRRGGGSNALVVGILPSPHFTLDLFETKHCHIPVPDPLDVGDTHRVKFTIRNLESWVSHEA